MGIPLSVFPYKTTKQAALQTLEQQLLLQLFVKDAGYTCINSTHKTNIKQTKFQYQPELEVPAAAPRC